MNMKFGDAPTERSAFELLTTVQTVTEFQESDIVLSDRVNQMPRGSELTKSEFVMIFVVQDIYERGQEWVEILMSANTISARNIVRKSVNKHRA